MMVENDKSGLDACEKYFLDLYGKSGEVLRLSFKHDDLRVQSRAHGFATDLQEWIKAIGPRPEIELFRAACGEYEFALFSLVMGNYRQAFMGLRAFFELALAAVYFSTRELDLRMILAGKKDVHWATIVDPDQGLFSTTFGEVFFEDLRDDSAAYGSIAQKLYRECSEFIHGNRSSFSNYEAVVEFQPQLFQMWHDKAKNCQLVISYALCLRYLKSVGSSNVLALEHHVMDHVGHIGAIREFFGGPR